MPVAENMIPETLKQKNDLHIRCCDLPQPIWDFGFFFFDCIHQYFEYDAGNLDLTREELTFKKYERRHFNKASLDP